MLAMRFQWVGVEESAAVDRHSRNHTVVEGAFKHIVVFCIAMHKKQPVVDVYVANGSACFAIGRCIWQFVVAAKRFTFVACTDAAGDVVFTADDVVPDGIDSVNIGWVAGKCSHVGHSGIHIHRSHGMPYSLALVDDR